MSDSRPQTDGLSREEFLGLLRVLSLPFAVCLLFLFVTPTASQPFRRSSADVRREVIGVVESQFTAFKDGDYARAYSFAAAGIQQQFNVTAFERMVKNGYPIIANWHAVSFGEMQDNGNQFDRIGPEPRTQETPTKNVLDDSRIFFDTGHIR